MAVIEFLDSRKVSLGVTTATIELLDSKKVSLQPSVVAEIELLDSRVLALTPSGNGGPECLVDSDCPSGYICVNGVCVPEGGNGGNGGEEEKEFPWLPVALIGGGAIIVLAALSKPKAITKKS
jgi:Cys-rich repeat protein